MEQSVFFKVSCHKRRERLTGQQVELHLAVLIGQSQRKSLLNQHPYLEDKQLFRSDTGQTTWKTLIDPGTKVKDATRELLVNGICPEKLPE